MPVRTFNIFEGMEGQALMRMFEATKEIMRDQSVGLANYLADNAKKIWMDYAKTHARWPGWGGRYAQAIKMDPMSSGGDGVARVYVDETDFGDVGGDKKSVMLWVGIVEKGIKAWSIRDALLNSKRIKIGRDGIRYIHVPFRWRTPGKKYAKSSEVFAGDMTDAEYKIVKSGVRLLGEQFGHKAGMARYGRSLHGSYFTFRTVSERTPKNKWQYPETPGTPIFAPVLERVKKMIAAKISGYVRNLAGDLPGLLGGQ